MFSAGRLALPAASSRDSPGARRRSPPEGRPGQQDGQASRTQSSQQTRWCVSRRHSRPRPPRTLAPSLRPGPRRPSQPLASLARGCRCPLCLSRDPSLRPQRRGSITRSPPVISLQPGPRTPPRSGRQTRSYQPKGSHQSDSSPFHRFPQTGGAPQTQPTAPRAFPAHPVCLAAHAATVALSERPALSFLPLPQLPATSGFPHCSLNTCLSSQGSRFAEGRAMAGRGWGRSVWRL